MNFTLRLLPAIALLSGTVNCHNAVKTAENVANAPKCNMDVDCVTGTLCHPTQKVCLSTYPDPRLLEASYDLKSCTPSNVYFAFDSAELVPEAQRWLEYDARCLKARQLNGLTVGGHADSRGSRDYNRDLAARRADAVKRFLESKGVAIPVVPVSYGEERPQKAGISEQDFAWNRRVVLRGR